MSLTSLRYKPATGSCTLNFNKFLSCWEPTFPWRKPTFRHQPGKTNDRCTPLCVGQARVGRGRVIERGWGRAGGKRSAGRSGHHPPARNDFDGLGFTGSRRQRANGRAVGRIGEILPNVPPPSAPRLDAPPVFALAGRQDNPRAASVGVRGLGRGGSRSMRARPGRRRCWGAGSAPRRQAAVGCQAGVSEGNLDGQVGFGCPFARGRVGAPAPETANLRVGATWRHHRSTDGSLPPARRACPPARAPFRPNRSN